ncbi:MAG: molybdenum cofactor guanylyltransferase [Anaerolineae bacterium]|jgi:molybdopterin-guanine dinucleotide biosynthesis protein A
MPEETAPAASIVILSGGKSTRLGQDKSLLELEGQPLIARAAHRLAALSDDLIIVANDREQYEPLALPARLVPDVRRGEGALMGIYSGLLAARHPYALAVACDMPFLNLPLLRYMLSLIDGYDVIIPRLDGYLEPLHAIYAKSCLPHMANLLDQGRRQIIAFFDQVRVRYVEQELGDLDPQQLSFLNVNTPADWARAQSLVAQEAVDTP